MRTFATVVALIGILWSADAIARSADNDVEVALKRCAGLEGYEAIKDCITKLIAPGNEASQGAGPPVEANVQTWLASCQKSEATSYLQECVRKLTMLNNAQERVRATLANLAKECAKETDDKLRLCVEGMAKVAAIPDETAKQRATAPAATAATPTLKGWHRAPDKESKIDGGRSVALFLFADEQISTDTGRKVWPSLALRCSENVTAFFVEAPGHFVTDSVAVTYRLDKDKPVSQTWSAASSHTAMGLWNGGQAIPFIKSLLNREEMVFRFKPYRTGNVEMTFTIAGLDKVIDQVRTACKW